MTVRDFFDWIIWGQKTHSTSEPHFMAVWIKEHGRRKLAFCSLAFSLGGTFLYSAARRSFTGARDYFLRVPVNTTDELRHQIHGLNSYWTLGHPLESSAQTTHSLWSTLTHSMFIYADSHLHSWVLLLDRTLTKTALTVLPGVNTSTAITLG